MATALLLALAMLGQSPTAAPAATAPTDDYGYVSWCYGALGGYLDLYDKVMPEVTRIEKAFPGPDGVEASLKTYPEMRAQARSDLKLYTAAITAAEKASPRPISEYGGAAIKKGRSVWAGSDAANKARLAQVWMSWSPPGDCEKRAKTLETRSNVLGKALIYNAAKPVEPPADVAPVAEPVAEPAMAETPAAMPAPEPAQEPGSQPQAPEMAPPAPLVKADDLAASSAESQPCAGRLEPVKRGGKTVLVCKPD